MSSQSALMVDYIAPGDKLHRFLAAVVVWTIFASICLAFDDRPLLQVPRPIAPAELSPDFSLGQPMPAAWNEPSAGVLTATSPPRQTSSPPDDWRQPPPVHPVSYPEELVDPEWDVPSYATAQPASGRPVRPPVSSRREGVFQRFAFRETFLAGGEISDFGILSSDVSVTLAFPVPSREMPLILTPAFAIHVLDGPAGVDLPNQLYDNSLKIQTMFKINERWGANIAVTPGWYSDFQSSNDEALRISGHAFAAWDQSPRVQWIFGVVYLDWQNISLLPAAGVIVKPNFDTIIELTFPRPRFAQRLGFTHFGDIWWYVAGELGGGTWAVSTAGGDDLVTISDYRLLVGVENSGPKGCKTFLEAGYVFGREIEFESATPDFDPSDTFLLRAGLTY